MINQNYSIIDHGNGLIESVRITSVEEGFDDLDKLLSENLK